MLRAIFRTYRIAFSGLPAAVWLIALVTFVNRAGTMVVPFLALYLPQKLGVSLPVAGQLLGVFGAGGVLGAYLGGVTTSRFGATRMVAVSFVLTLPCLVAVALTDTVLSTALALFVFGVLSNVYRPAGATATIERCDPKDHARAMAVHRLAINLGMSIGPSVGGFVSMVSFSALFLLDGATTVLALILLLAFFGLKDPRKPDPVSEVNPLSARLPFRDGKLLAFLGLLILTMLVFFQVEGAYLLHLNGPCGFSRADIGLLLAINPVLIVLFEMVFVHWMRHFNPLRAFGVGAVLVGVSFGVLLLGCAPWVAVLSVMIWTLGEMITMPLSAAFVSARSDSTNRGRYMGAYIMAFSVAAILAPLLGMFIYARSPEGLWLGCVGVSVAVALGCWVMGKRG